MSWFDKLKRKGRNFGIPNLIGYVVVTMFVVFVADSLLGMNLSSYLSLSKDAILAGQVWRLITFIFLPPNSSMFFIIISLLFYYSIGTSLESAWGSSTFTRYYLLGIVGTIISAMITGYATNTYLNLSLVLAYAQLFPDNQFTLYFVVPIKAKYIGYAQLIIYGITLLVSIYSQIWWSVGALIASLINFFIFFGPSIIRDIKNRNNVRKRQRNYRRNLRKGNDDDDTYNPY